jgi:hypothetical protein
MAIRFNDDSDVLLPGPHPATVPEIEERLVDGFPQSQTRRPIFEDWNRLLAALTDEIPIRTHWMHGSYVTTKLNPGDVDVVSHYDGPAFDALDPATRDRFNALISGKGIAAPRCDSLAIAAYPEGHEAHEQYLLLAAPCEEMCRSDRNGNPRGYIDLRDECLTP